MGIAKLVKLKFCQCQLYENCTVCTIGIMGLTLSSCSHLDPYSDIQTPKVRNYLLDILVSILLQEGGNFSLSQEILDIILGNILEPAKVSESQPPCVCNMSSYLKDMFLCER